MSVYEFILKLLGLLVSWPVVVLGLILFFRKSVKISAKEMLDRLISLKWGSLQAHFTETTLRMIKADNADDPKNKISEEEKRDLRISQVVYSTPNLKLYANGVIVEHLDNFKILPNTSSRQIVYPLSLPNELTSIQIIGDIDGKILSGTLSNCTIAFSPSQQEREIHIIISGL